MFCEPVLAFGATKLLAITALHCYSFPLRFPRSEVKDWAAKTTREAEKVGSGWIVALCPLPRAPRWPPNENAAPGKQSPGAGEVC